MPPPRRPAGVGAHQLPVGSIGRRPDIVPELIVPNLRSSHHPELAVEEHAGHAIALAPNGIGPDAVPPDSITGVPCEGAGLTLTDHPEPIAEGDGGHERHRPVPGGPVLRPPPPAGRDDTPPLTLPVGLVPGRFPTSFQCRIDRRGGHREESQRRDPAEHADHCPSHTGPCDGLVVRRPSPSANFVISHLTINDSQSMGRISLAVNEERNRLAGPT